jgi:transposase-like protein
MITLSLDNLTKIVATQAQADVLLKQGYSYVSGSAEATDVSLAATTGYVESGNGNPSYRGDGCLGELDGGMLHLIKTAMAGDNVTSDMLAVMREAYRTLAEAGAGDAIFPIFTEMEAVTELPDIGEADINTLYLLTETDGEFPMNIYAPDYDTFTPLSEFDIGRAPAAVLAQLSAAYDNPAQIVVDDVSSQSAIEAHILPLIQAEIDVIDDNFTASFVGINRWDAQSRTWTGKIKLTGEDNAAYTFTDSSTRAWTVGQEAETVHGEISAAYDTASSIIVDDYSSKAAVEAFILPLIQAEVSAYDNHFTVSFVSSTYDAPTCVWTGKVKVADNDITANTYQDSAARTWTIGIPAEGIHEQISAAYNTGATIEVTDYSSKATVEAFILPLIQAEIDAIDNNFTASFDSSSYDDQAHTWTGKIKVQDEGITGNSFTDATARTWTITQAT